MFKLCLLVLTKEEDKGKNHIPRSFGTRASRVYDGGNQIKECELDRSCSQWRKNKLCAKFQIEILKVIFRWRSMDNLTETFCYDFDLSCERINTKIFAFRER